MPSLIDDRCLLTKSPFRSGYFVVVSAMGVASMALVVYLLGHFWQELNFFVAIALSVPIGCQLLYQWLRVLKYYSKIRESYSKRPAVDAIEGNTDDEALRIAAGGITDVLFYSNGMILCSLAIIAALLAHR